MNQPPVPHSKPVKRIGRGPISLVAGATYPLRALWLFIRIPRLRGYVLVPILVNIVLGITIYAGLLTLGMQAIDALFANLPTVTAELSQEVSGVAARLPHWTLTLPHWQIAEPGWLPHLPVWNLSLPQWSVPLPDWLSNWTIRFPRWVDYLSDWGFALFLGIIRLILIVALFALTGFIFLQFGVLLGSPWYGKLSEEIERLQTGQVVLVEVNPAVEIWRAIAYELKKLALTLPIGIPLLLLHFFPGVGTLIAAIGGISLASTIACMDFLDAAVERRRPTFRQKLGVVVRSLPASASFGITCFGLVSIPFVNLVAIPICVGAGTLFFCDRVLPWFHPPISPDPSTPSELSP